MEDNYIEEIASTLEQLYLSNNIDKVNELGEKLKKFSNEDIVHVLKSNGKLAELLFDSYNNILLKYDTVKNFIEKDKELINIKGNYLRGKV